jgi:hypothetical protein
VQVSWRVGAGQTLAEAGRAVIDEIGGLGGDGGLIALDRDGNIAAPFNSQGMKRAWLTPDGEIGVEVFGRYDRYQPSGLLIGLPVRSIPDQETAVRWVDMPDARREVL